jgi:TatD family hydrolase
MRYLDELPEVVARARAAGVSGMAVIGTRAMDSEAAADLASREVGIVAAAGIHPNDVGEVVAGEWDRIVALAESGRVAAIGETGLDWYRDHAPKDVQREWFDRHLRLAQRLALPLVIHTRESIADVLAMLREAIARRPLAAILHAFTGTAAEAAEAIDLGCHLGFAGMVTFRSSAQLREVRFHHGSQFVNFISRSVELKQAVGSRRPQCNHVIEGRAKRSNQLGDSGNAVVNRFRVVNICFQPIGVEGDRLRCLLQHDGRFRQIRDERFDTGVVRDDSLECTACILNE